MGKKKSNIVKTKSNRDYDNLEELREESHHLEDTSEDDDTINEKTDTSHNLHEE
jgi:hypothetical protein